MSELISKWSVNESLLQSHRSIFISSQTFFIAVGALLLQTDKPEWLLWLLTGSGLTIIWWFWFRVVVIRARIVDYYKFQLYDQNKAIFDNCSEEEYVKNKEKRDLINEKIGKSNWRTTRKKMDLGLPVIFSIIWLALLAARYCLA
ncbi:MAG: hypothetical protein SRB1_00402 [Desulfobacteraceae bacterium Eth-SRB1]|nr:MAG: hypothetical protein SRB1_00402 [Desulfobacteraceae bacterium Eth-SRB1]